MERTHGDSRKRPAWWEDDDPLEDTVELKPAPGSRQSVPAWWPNTKTPVLFGEGGIERWSLLKFWTIFVLAFVLPMAGVLFLLIR